ncbi:MAG: hypothetical protein DCF22_06570 [Leptolyngbya sp.]|nr:MAG: hypothetical protein DCF22_06570 [Leptolyngbya sp.]
MNNNVPEAQLRYESAKSSLSNLECPWWREAHLSTMKEWHPLFKEVDFLCETAREEFRTLFKAYSELLLNESTDEPDDLFRHIQEEVCAFIHENVMDIAASSWAELPIELRERTGSTEE